MPRLCTVCTSDDRAAIDEAIVSGAASRTIAHRFGVTRDAAMRHREHISRALTVVRERRETEGAETLYDRAEALYARAAAILERVEASGREHMALGAIRELRATIELIGKLTGELNATTTNVVNIIASEDWVRLRADLLAALPADPDQRAAVVRRLRELDPS